MRQYMCIDRLFMYILRVKASLLETRDEAELQLCRYTNVF